jgi:transposase
VVRRGELTDSAWAVIAPLLPEAGVRNGRWRDHRQVINGILWKLRTGRPVAGSAGAVRAVEDLPRAAAALVG